MLREILLYNVAKLREEEAGRREEASLLKQRKFKTESMLSCTKIIKTGRPMLNSSKIKQDFSGGTWKTNKIYSRMIFHESEPTLSDLEAGTGFVKMPLDSC